MKKEFTKRITKLFVSILFLTLISQQLNAATITAAMAGNWQATATWIGGVVPGSSDDVIIPTGINVNILSSSGSRTVNSLNLSGGTGSVTVNATSPAALTITSSVNFGGLGTIAGSGPLTIASGASITTANATGLAGSISNFTSRTLLLPTNGNYTFNGTAAQTTGALPANVNNLTINNSSGLDPTITLNNTGGITINGALTLTAGIFKVAGDRIITIGSAATISVAAGTLDVNTGTLTKIAFNNTTNLSLPTTLFSTNPKNMEVNGGGITLGANLTVVNTLTLTSGKITLGANDLNVNGSISGTSSSNYIVTDGAGFLVLPIPASIATTSFPIGTSTTYRPATVEYTTAPAVAGTLKARFIASAPATTGLPITEGMSTVDAVSPTGYWRLNSGPTDGVYTVTLDAIGFTKADGVTAISSLTGLRLIKRPTLGSWAATTTTTTTDPSSLSSLSSAGLTGFSDFALGAPAVVLPIELSRFEVKKNQKSAILAWVTASEKDNAQFNIQHSTNGVDFTTIGTVKGQGTKAATTTYNYEHSTPSVGTNYYRLAQVDFNGTTTYSAVKSAIFGKGGLAVKSTLVQDFVTVVTTDESTPLSIFNIAGQQVLQIKVQGEQNVNVGHLPSGLYFIRTMTGDVARFIKE
jgi:hypothetical protein